MKYQAYIDFYIPSRKEEYINFLCNHYPQINIGKWLKMKKDRLKAIYIAIRSRKG